MPPGLFGLDRLVSDFRPHGGGRGPVRGAGTPGGGVGGLAGSQALILYRLVRRVDVADKDRHINRGQKHVRSSSRSPSVR